MNPIFRNVKLRQKNTSVLSSLRKQTFSRPFNTIPSSMDPLENFANKCSSSSLIQQKSDKANVIAINSIEHFFLKMYIERMGTNMLPLRPQNTKILLIPLILLLPLILKLDMYVCVQRLESKVFLRFAQ